ncbi:DUF5683 domain-containing protein [Marseilla massiliensis]|uniref:DUF5683 domain-containing protein n=1 Tax=Marseilla massiliensis TaxID=1841864 RepID=A0A939B6Z8_9BACT|nr:DUF5683 domain-containing protein [Marseilla massiliensis]MBM6673075.1 hypothetical protein [Marseilla massiliensis]
MPCKGHTTCALPFINDNDSTTIKTDSLSANVNDSIAKIITAVDSANLNRTVFPDSTGKKKKEKRDWSTWRPSAKRAMWLAIVIPGAGQIYNRKYWKLPIVYGGFLGCLYAIRWNNQMYQDYSQAYMDIMDNDPNTQSYNEFLHLGNTITPENTERYQDLFRRRKDYYRRYRDLSVFCLIAVYALSVIDAYVDASLSEFDISQDLSFKVEPAIINNGSSLNPLKSSSVGIQCSINF